MIYLERIAITNLGGFDAYTAKFYDTTVVLGGNEQGKSSFLNSVATIFQGGADLDLLKTGTSTGKVKIDFFNGYSATKIIDPSKKPAYTVFVEDENGGKIVSGAASKLQELVPKDKFDVRNLVRMVLYDQKALEKFLLDNLPITFLPDEVNTAARGLKIVKTTLSLPELNSLRQALYDRRTEINRSRAEATATLKSLEEAAGPEDPTDWGAERDKLAGVLSQIEIGIASEESAIRLEAEQARNEHRATAGQQLAALDIKLAQYVAEAKAYPSIVLACTGFQMSTLDDLSAAAHNLHNGAIQYSNHIQDRHVLSLGLANKLKTIDEMEASEIKLQTATTEARRAQVSLELGTAREKADNQQRSAGVRSGIESQKKRLEGHVTEEVMLTSAIASIDTLKTTKLKALPIDGLDIVTDGKTPTITVKGVPLSRINTQNQIRICVKFIAEAQKASGCEMKILVVEGAEIDLTHLMQLSQFCMEEQIQLIISILVDGEPLQIMPISELVNRSKKLKEVA